MSKILPKGTIIMYHPEKNGMEFDYEKFIECSKNNFKKPKLVPLNYNSYPYEDENLYFNQYMVDEIDDNDWYYKNISVRSVRIEEFYIYGPKAFMPSKTFKMMITDVKKFKFNIVNKEIVFYECIDLDFKREDPYKLKFFIKSEWVIPVTQDCSSSLDFRKNIILDKIRKKRNI